jgi:aspartate aminotransferase
MPALSKRAESLGTENAFVVLAEVNALIRAGKDVISFCIGQPDFPTPVHIQDAAVAAVRGGKHGYTPSAGIDELRAAAAASMSRLRGLDITPDEVVVGAGAKPFIAYAIASVTDHGAGDEVIFPVPGFPIYESQCKALGAVPVGLPLRESRKFAFDPDELASRITPKTKLLILNTPHNPTGGLLTSRTCRRSPRCCAGTSRCGCMPTRSTASSSTTANSPRSPRCPACASAPSFRTARPRPTR